MIKLVVSDLDGTLLPYGGCGLSAYTREYIRQIADRGALFSICTGRDLAELNELSYGIGEGLIKIAFDGALATRGSDVIFEKRIPRQTLADACRLMRDPLFFHTMEGGYRIGALTEDVDDPRLRAFTEIKSVGEIAPSVGVYKITKFKSPLPLGKTSALRLHWDGREVGRFEYLNRYCNKGSAIASLQTKLMISHFDTAAVGDGDNDAPMLKEAALRIAVSDRSEVLLQVANVKTECAEQALRTILARMG